MTSSKVSETESVVCPACTCCCDDIRVIVSGEGVVQAENACDLGVGWFTQPLSSQPACKIDGQPKSVGEGVAAAAEMMRRARYPLVCGLDTATIQAQQRACRIAKECGACIDTTLSPNLRSGIFALQRHGLVTATLGEVASRSDLVVFWFCDPAATHPRHLERYSAATPRKIIVVDQQQTATADQADQFVQIPAAKAGPAVWVLRGLLADITLDDDLVFEQTGRRVADWTGLANALKSAKYGAIFYAGIDAEAEFDLTVDGLHLLAKELNRLTRFACCSLRKDRNALGAENVLASSNGYPFAVNASRPQPRFHYLEYAADSVLARGDCDAAMILSAESFGQLSTPAQKHLESIDRVTFSYGSSSDSVHVSNGDCRTVAFSVCRPGFSDAGQLCRQDDVVLPLRHLVNDDSVSMLTVLARIEERLLNGR